MNACLKYSLAKVIATTLCTLEKHVECDFDRAQTCNTRYYICESIVLLTRVGKAYLRDRLHALRTWDR